MNTKKTNNLRRNILKRLKMDNSELIAFKAISEFVSALGESFGKRNKPIALYARLVEKTTLSHVDAIRRHVKAFTNFCVSNRKVIQDKNTSEFSTVKISYSDRVFIDISVVFRLADKSEKRVVWQHLLTISALVDKESKAKEVLRGSGSNEGNFIEQAFDEIKETLDGQDIDASNPMAVAMNLMGSGVFQNLLNGITTGVDDGSLDINSLMGTMQQMLGNIQQQTATQPEQKQDTIVAIEDTPQAE